MARLGDVCEILNGYAFKSEKYVDTGIRIIRISNVQKGYIEDNMPVFYPSDDINSVKYQLFEGDILLSLTGNVGRVGILEKKFVPAALNQRVACLRIKDNNILYKPYLFNFLNSDFFEERCIFSAKGVAQKNMSTEWLKDYQIPLLPIEEQQKIAAVLDKVSDLIAKRRQQLEKLDLLVKARFVEMFCNPIENANWEFVNMADISTDMRTGPFGSALRHNEFVETGIFVLGIDNAVENRFTYNRMRYITEEKYEQLKRYTVRPGDVIITIMGTVGRSAVIPDNIPKAINTKHLACLTINRSKAQPMFVCCAFQMHPEIRQQLTGQAKGAIMDGLNLTIIKKLSFKLPPLEIQNEFVKFFGATEKTKTIIEESLMKLETIKKALMQEYFG